MHAHGTHGLEDLKKHVRIYISVFVALMVLTIVTVGVSYLGVHLGWATWTAVVAALVIASIKGSLVALYFMHLISEVKIIYWTLALCAAFFAVLMMLPTFTERNQSGVVHHNDRTVAGAHAGHAESGHAEHSGSH
jgi:cytochrome c oxidase subunit 4